MENKDLIDLIFYSMVISYTVFIKYFVTWNLPSLWNFTIGKLTSTLLICYSMLKILKMLNLI